MKNEYATTLVYSLAIHGLIILVIIFIPHHGRQHIIQNPKKNTLLKPKTIKSFLYVQTKTPVTPPAKATLPKDDMQSTHHQATTKKIKTIASPNNKAQKSTVNIAKNNNATATSVDSKNDIKDNKEKKLSEPTKKFDRYSQLQKLRHQINQAASQLSTSYNSKYHTPSIFNPIPNTVPHAVPLTDIHKNRDKNTKQIDSSIAITKGDDGVCSIKQDLSTFGLDAPTSIQYFACGEDQFDANFRKHMTQVNNKLKRH